MQKRGKRRFGISPSYCALAFAQATATAMALILAVRTAPGPLVARRHSLTPYPRLADRLVCQIIIGRVLGKDALGAHSFPTTFSALGQHEVGSISSRVVPGIFSDVQNNRDELRRSPSL